MAETNGVCQEAVIFLQAGAIPAFDVTVAIEARDVRRTPKRI